MLKHTYLHNTPSRLDKYLAQVLAISRKISKERILDGLVSVNDKIVTSPKYLLECNDVIAITQSEPSESQELQEIVKSIPLNIVFEDEHIIVINKQRGITVHKGPSNDISLCDVLLAKGIQLSNITASRPGVVHRLDKDTSGLLIMAKTNQAHEKLADSIKNRDVQRVYLALCYGEFSKPTGTIETFYGRHKRIRTKRCAVEKMCDHFNRKAITHYNVLAQKNNIALVEVRLETGRTHQIRVHMTYIGHPVVGDQVYGKELNFNLKAVPLKLYSYIKMLNTQALHAYKLTFHHPITNDIIELSAPLPEFANLAFAYLMPNCKYLIYA